jgi:asparagine synthase (glutamine-hydrolysing)
LDTALGRTIERHRLGEAPGMLLSGGRDSRLIAGYMTEGAHRVDALTLGAETDLEMRCAAAVARVLDCPHRTMDLDEAHFPDFAALQAEWEQLGSGFANVHMWGAVAALRELPARVFAGHNLEIRSSDPMPHAFDELFGGVKNRGFQPATLRRLLKPQVFDDLVDTLDRERRTEYEAGSSSAEDRPARFFLAHDRRAHAGGVPWKLSFGSWPILPILDRALLETIFALPSSALANRRAQDEILRRRFPHLARLPLDRNARHVLPLLPSPAQRLTNLIGRATEPISRRFPGARERRYYHRIYDVNGPGWRAIRRRAEPHRERVAPLLDMDVLAELVPQPDARLPVRNTITDSFAPKLLIGLMMWSAHHLS